MNRIIIAIAIIAITGGASAAEGEDMRIDRSHERYGGRFLAARGPAGQERRVICIPDTDPAVQQSSGWVLTLAPVQYGLGDDRVVGPFDLPKAARQSPHALARVVWQSGGTSHTLFIDYPERGGHYNIPGGPLEVSVIVQASYPDNASDDEMPTFRLSVSPGQTADPSPMTLTMRVAMVGDATVVTPARYFGWVAIPAYARGFHATLRIGSDARGSQAFAPWGTDLTWWRAEHNLTGFPVQTLYALPVGDNALLRSAHQGNEWSEAVVPGQATSLMWTQTGDGNDPPDEDTLDIVWRLGL